MVYEVIVYVNLLGRVKGTAFQEIHTILHGKIPF